MTITSFSYFTMLLAGVIIYYIMPRAGQWIVLLTLSILFYCVAATPYTLLYLGISTLTAWGVTNWLEQFRQKNKSAETLGFCRIFVMAVIGINILLWFILKGSQFFIIGYNLFGRLFTDIGTIEPVKLVAALGMGYYTLQIIGYILDCYWETARPQKNILKLFLFTAFFPQLVTGPISRYNQLNSLFERHKFSYLTIAHGAQRILWGVFKKLVLAERVGIIVNGIWSDLATYDGLYVWVALLLYPIQMYSDFSGCMDIVIGSAELFDIKLAENFNNPFFSKSSQEFWQRWHITLGTWAKDYILFPILKSKLIISLGKKLKKKYGKKTGKFLSTAIGMFALWMVMGVWHGAPKYVIGVSLWYWIILMLGEFAAPFFSEFVVKLNFRIKSFSWELFQMVRTYLIYAVGAVFFRAEGIKAAIAFLESAFISFKKENWNPWIFFDESILNLGVTYLDLNIIIFSIACLLLVGILREKYGYARNWLDQQTIVFRWFIWMALFSITLIYGKYGDGYNAAEFIYQGF